MRIISIDPGYERLGIAILEKNPREKGVPAGRQEKLLFSECFQTSAEIPFSERLHQLGLEIRKIIEEYKPEQLAFEKLFFNTNTTTALHVAEVRGVISYEASLHGITIFEYSPSQIKVAVAGDGHADKKQVWTMVGKLLHIEKKIEFDDEYDAIATGLTHFAHHNVA